MERSLAPSMDLSKPSTHVNLEAAFGGESMANRKYLFFSEVAKQLGHRDLAKLFRDTAAQETEHAFAHFRLLHPELVVNDPEQLSDEKKQAILSRTAAKNFGLLTPIEQHHAETYGVALEALQGKGTAGQSDQPIPGKWICNCLLYTSPSPRDMRRSRMPSSA